LRAIFRFQVCPPAFAPFRFPIAISRFAPYPWLPNDGVSCPPTLLTQPNFTRKNLSKNRTESPKPKAGLLNAGLVGFYIFNTHTTRITENYRGEKPHRSCPYLGHRHVTFSRFLYDFMTFIPLTEGMPHEKI
jgi:hypothetical protein